MRPTKNTLDPARLPPMLKTDQAAEIIGVSQNTIRKWAADGTLKAKKIGKKLWRFPREEVEKWLT